MELTSSDMSRAFFNPLSEQIPEKLEYWLVQYALIHIKMQNAKDKLVVVEKIWWHGFFKLWSAEQSQDSQPSIFIDI